MLNFTVNPSWQNNFDMIGSIDTFLINLFTYNLDALRLSTYYNLARNGKFSMSPIWDFDRSLNCGDDGRLDATMSNKMTNRMLFNY